MTAFRDAFPILYVADVARATSFYEGVFGFRESFRWPQGGKPTFAFLQLDPIGIGVAARTAEVSSVNPGREFELCIYTDDVDAAAAKLEGASAELVRPAADEPWGERRAYFRDLDGHLLHVCAKLEADA